MSQQSSEPGPAAGRLRFLDPARLRFSQAGALLRLTVEGERSHLRVALRRAFPLTRPESFLSILDDGGGEIGMLRDPGELDPESRRLVQADLDRRYRGTLLQRIVSVRERFGVVEWQVETQRGPTCFTTRDLRDHVLQPRAHGYSFTDVDGNRYDVPDIRTLDPASRARLLRHL